jgi:hypothetical protein
MAQVQTAGDSRSFFLAWSLHLLHTSRALAVLFTSVCFLNVHHGIIRIAGHKPEVAVCAITFYPSIDW